MVSPPSLGAKEASKEKIVRPNGETAVAAGSAETEGPVRHGQEIPFRAVFAEYLSFENQNRNSHVSQLAKGVFEME